MPQGREDGLSENMSKIWGAWVTPSVKLCLQLQS